MSLSRILIKVATTLAGTPKDILASRIGEEVHVGSSMSGDGERRIDYHVFELEIDPNSLCDNWYACPPPSTCVAFALLIVQLYKSLWILSRPESKERRREWVSVPEALARCEAWANEKNTKIDLYMGFKQCRVHKRYLDSIAKTQTNGIEVKVGVGTAPPTVASANGGMGVKAKVVAP
jgi:hypothetical protein